MPESLTGELYLRHHFRGKRESFCKYIAEVLHGRYFSFAVRLYLHGKEGRRPRQRVDIQTAFRNETSDDTYASKTNWEETTYPLAKGYFIFVEPFNEDCLIHWKINPRGIILSYFPEGNGCGSARGTAHETSQIEDVSPPAK